jgi:hypothetical protein
MGSSRRLAQHQLPAKSVAILSSAIVIPITVVVSVAVAPTMVIAIPVATVRVISRSRIVGVHRRRPVAGDPTAIRPIPIYPAIAGPRARGPRIHYDRRRRIIRRSADSNSNRNVRRRKQGAARQQHQWKQSLFHNFFPLSPSEVHAPCQHPSYSKHAH